jgi:hypothetical protein
MSFIWIVLRATAVVGGLMAALVTGGIAHADTTPSLPGVADLGAAVANAPQLLQSVGSALGVLPHPAPAAPPPLAGASITVPQGAVPGMPAAPAPSASSPLAGIPGLTAPGASAAGSLRTAGRAGEYAVGTRRRPADAVPPDAVAAANNGAQ